MTEDRAMLEARAAARIELERRRESLLDFIPRVSPHLDAPFHLARFVAVLERARRESVRLVVSTPPQHGKTFTTEHAVVQDLQLRPKKRSSYVTYQAGRAEAISVEIQKIATDAGLAWEGNRSRWLTSQGGGLLATGIGGPLTGYPIDGTLYIDDPFKNREEADSAIVREHHYNWFTSTALTRVHPGASIVVVATRWHPDDLSGRLIARGWEVVNLPAIGPDELALWEAKRPLAWLKQVRADIGEYDWNALYQGEPRNRGDAVFKDPTSYAELPRQCRYSIGADFAYSTRTYADYSVLVVLAHDPLTKLTYVVDLYRGQVEAPEFQNELLARQTKFNATTTAYIGGTERGIVDFMKRGGVRINALTASTDKFTRAQPVAAAWNAGVLQVPRSAPWRDAFVSELTGFTGIRDRHDDQVDALAGAFVPFASPAAPRGVGQIPLGIR